METALYFPYIRVPQTPWFTQVLLYWDKAASIVPSSLWHQPDAVDPYMRDLAEAKLLDLLSPNDGAGNVGSGEFDRGFMRLLDSRTQSGEGGKFARIHTGKMSYGLFRELQRRGLAQPSDGPGRDTWWRVKTSTAELYMAYLASVMSAATPGILPVTDRMDAVGALAGTTNSLEQRLSSLRYRTIMEALPAPRGPVAPAKLRGFKEDHAEQLQRCRRFLDGKLADLASKDDDELREVRLGAIMQEIEDDVATLMDQMNKRKWPGVALLGFGGVMGAALTTAAAVVTGGTALAVGLAVGSGLTGLGGAGYSAVDLIRRPQFDPRAPLAYAALASRQL